MRREVDSVGWRSGPPGTGKASEVALKRRRLRDGSGSDGEAGGSLMVEV
jgi:hypothetical protein